MTNPDPLGVAAAGDWPSFINPLIDRATAARERNQPVSITRAELAELNRRTDTRLDPDDPDSGVAPFDGDGPFTFFGWPVLVVDR